MQKERIWAMRDDLIKHANLKAHECRIMSRAYSIWLTRLTPVNVLLVAGGALLSLVAGSSLLTGSGIITETHAGIMALFSAGFAIIHKSLNCDQHQAECRKLKNIYAGLAESYSDLNIIDDDSALKSKLDDLNTEYAHIVKNSTAEPYGAAVQRAQNELA